MKKISLYFENGMMLEAKSFGAEGTSVGEVVFNTPSHPSYHKHQQTL